MPKIPVKYTVEKNIPVPVVRPGRSGVPLQELDIGHSVVFNLEYRNAVQSFATRLKKREGKEFTVSKISGQQCRVWRVK